MLTVITKHCHATGLYTFINNAGTYPVSHAFTIWGEVTSLQLLNRWSNINITHRVCSETINHETFHRQPCVCQPLLRATLYINILKNVRFYVVSNGVTFCKHRYTSGKNTYSIIPHCTFTVHHTVSAGCCWQRSTSNTSASFMTIRNRVQRHDKSVCWAV